MGELARKPGAPELPRTPLEILTPRPDKAPTVVDKYLFPVFGAIGGVAMINILNVFQNRPIYAGIYRHVALGAIGWFTMSIVGEWKRESKMDRDAVLRHYVTLHPEEFPPFERKRVGDMFDSWTPIR